MTKETSINEQDLSELYSDDFMRFVTLEEIQNQAKSFWRDSEFFGICCEDESSDNECEFHFAGLTKEKDVVIFNDCPNHDDTHSYYIKLVRKPDLDKSGFTVYPYSPIKCPTGVTGFSAQNYEPITLSEIETKFWDEVAKLYPTIPLWMIEYDLDAYENILEEEKSSNYYYKNDDTHGLQLSWSDQVNWNSQWNWSIPIHDTIEYQIDETTLNIDAIVKEMVESFVFEQAGFDWPQIPQKNTAISNSWWPYFQPATKGLELKAAPELETYVSPFDGRQK